MSAIAVFAPVVIASWPALGAAAAAAAASLGFSLADQAVGAAGQETNTERKVSLELPGSEIVTGGLGRAQQVRVMRDGVVATFSRDARGQASICVSGSGHSESELKAIGEELGGRLVQQYVLQKLKSELESHGMNLVEETVDAHSAVRLRVRHWQN